MAAGIKIRNPYTFSTYVVALEGLDDARFEGQEEKVAALAAKAINATARRYRTQASRAIREQVAFPARYLDARDSGRLRVSRFARPNELSATIQGRFEPTSLARFAKTKTLRKAGVTVEVAPGNRKKMNRAFLLGLNSGNTGLAIRLKPGERVENKDAMVAAYSTRTANKRRPSDRNLYLLYGPSVNQVFRSVAGDISPDAADYLEREFLRLTEALF